MTQLSQQLQGLLAPTIMRVHRTALANIPFCAHGCLLFLVLTLPSWGCLPSLAHVDSKGAAEELQHPLMKEVRRGKEQDGPDAGEGPLTQALGPGATQACPALVLPSANLLQTPYQHS